MVASVPIKTRPERTPAGSLNEYMNSISDRLSFLTSSVSSRSLSASRLPAAFSTWKLPARERERLARKVDHLTNDRQPELPRREREQLEWFLERNVPRQPRRQPCRSAEAGPLDRELDHGLVRGPFCIHHVECEDDLAHGHRPYVLEVADFILTERIQMRADPEEVVIARDQVVERRRKAAATGKKYLRSAQLDRPRGAVPQRSSGAKNARSPSPPPDSAGNRPSQDERTLFAVLLATPFLLLRDSRSAEHDQHDRKNRHCRDDAPSVNHAVELMGESPVVSRWRSTVR